MLRAIAIGLRRLMARNVVEAELDDEVRHYLEMATAAHMAKGLSRADAERVARIEFGGADNVKDQLRASGWDAPIATVWQDIQFGVRLLRRNPAFTIVALSTLAVGIGANTAMFSVVRAVMLRPLPYRDAHELALLWSDDRRRGLHEGQTAYQTVLDWRGASRSFADMAIFSRATVTFAGEPLERGSAALVSANLFTLLGVPPALGRVMTADEEIGRAHVAVISHALWQRRFGGDSAILGRTLTFAEAGKGALPASRIIGVMPPSFAFPDRTTQFWVPATLYWRWERERAERFPASMRRWSVVGRLARGVSIADAQGELNAIGARLDALHPPTVPDFPGFTPRVVRLLEQITGPRLQASLWLLFGAVGLVLVIACANVANLLLARGATRQHELATRRALGASRSRIASQLLSESVMLAIGGGALGVALSVVATRAMAVTAGQLMPRFDEITVDTRVLTFACAISLLTGIVFGAFPAWRATRVHPSAALQEGGHAAGSPRRRRTSASLVAAECALSVVLLVGAGLLLRSLAQLMAVDPGFRPDGILSVRLALPPQRAPSPSEVRTNAGDAGFVVAERAAALDALLDRLTATPGVEGAALADDILIRGEPDESITIPGRPNAASGQLYTSALSPEAFAVMQVPLRSGRRLTRADVTTKIRALWGGLPDRRLSLVEQSQVAVAEPVVVNETFARRFFPGEEPVGKRFCIDPTGKTYWYEIVGVVGDMRRQSLELVPVAEYFQLLLMRASGELLVRTRGDPLAFAATVRRLVSNAFAGAVVLNVTTVDQRLGAPTMQRRFQAALLTLFAGVALLLAAIGIYGIVHYAVAERRREIGVRMALGASPREVASDVILRGMTVPLVGIVIGLAGAAGASRMLTGLVYGISTTDPISIIGTVVALMGCACLACVLPARRASRIDPAIALRGEH